MTNDPETAEIVRDVAKRTRVREVDLLGTSRNHAIQRARWIAIYVIARTSPWLSKSEIARRMTRKTDSRFISKAVAWVDGQLPVDFRMRGIVTELLARYGPTEPRRDDGESS